MGAFDGNIIIGRWKNSNIPFLVFFVTKLENLYCRTALLFFVILRERLAVA